MSPAFSIPRHAAALALLLASFTVPASAQTQADLFDDTALHTVEIVMHSRDWSDLHANFRSNDHYPCDVIWNGLRMRNVAVRSRGNGSRYEAKPGLELSFDYYASQQRFLGLRGLVLDNLVTDPSMIRESTAMALMRRVGVPATREAPARVFVNGAYAGLYMMVEPVDTVFAQKAFEQPGLLFEYRWTYPFFATFPGESLDPYAVLFESRNLGVHSTAELYTPMRELFRMINEAPEGAFGQVDRYLDLTGLVRTLGASTFMAEWDGVFGYDGMNNFYLYRTGEQAHLIPWDRDQAFHAVDYPLLAGVDQNVLGRRLLEDAALRAAFVQAVTEVMAAAQSDTWLEREFTRQYTLIRDAALADTFKLSTNDQFEQAFTELIAFARQRPSFVLGELAPLR
ncbi:MAG TPA: CotH kinase family protein [Vicinamibacterales bacterium]|jgi:spore coat protein CotH|nr:CotH kinase family protein [Vicinamibacterales bacterium]